MPINNDGQIKYTIPTNIRAMITSEFCTQFLKELHCVFGVSVKDSEMDCFVYQGGTGGWTVAWDTACRKLGLDELCKYYHALPWYDSDIFDGEIEDILVEQKLVLGGFVDDEIARQNGLSAEDVRCCDRCGKYYHIDDIEKKLIRYEADEEIGCEAFDDVEIVCKSCRNEGTATELALDWKRMVSEVLEKSETDFFVCEKCGKMHYNAHRGEKHCLHCEYTEKSTNKNANDYYLAMYEKSKMYRDSLR